MPNVQMQEEPRPQAAEEPEEPEQETRPVAGKEHHKEEKESKLIRNLMIVIGTVILAAGSLRIGMYARSHNRIPTLLEAKPGYLSLDEYALLDSETKEPVQTMTYAEFERKYTFINDIYHYETKRGIKAGDSWYSFNEAYGDCIPSVIEVDPGDGRSAPEIESGITVSEFYEEYILSGEIDPTADDVTIIFFTGTDGLKLYYDKEELRQKSDAFFHSPRITHPLRRVDDYAAYELYFSFGQDMFDQGDIQLISSDKIDL